MTRWCGVLISIAVSSTVAHSGPPCPPVALVHGSGDPATTLNWVFVPSGFEETDLPRWRCTVERLVTDLMALEPFASHACAISVHRIDLAHCSGGTPRSSDCAVSETTCPEKPPDWGGVCDNAATDLAYGQSRLEEQRVSGDLAALSRLRMDLGVSLCGDNVFACHLLGLDAVGETHVRELASCAPAPDVVIVVANSGNVAGFETPAGTPPIVGITLEGIAVGTPAHLLAHEIGHAFRLGDEYSHGSGPGWECGRNVFEATRCGSGVPWADSCTDPASLGSDTCLESVDVDGCVTHGNVPDGCVTCDDRAPPIGLWEGAAYQPCSAYRPSEDCKMGERYTQDYCPVCRELIEEAFIGLQECSDVVTDVRRLDIRQSQEDLTRWEMICSDLVGTENPCAPPEVPEFDSFEMRAEFERDGIRYLAEIDRLIVRGPSREGAWEWSRDAGRRQELRVRRRPGSGPSGGPDELARKLEKGPVRLPENAVLAVPRGQAKPIPIRRAWIITRKHRNED